MNKKFLKVVILSLSCYIASTMAVSPALADIAKAFPGVSSSSIQMIISLPSLLCIPFSLLAGALSNKIGKRPLVLIGMTLLTLGGVAPTFTNSFIFVMISRCVFGIGVGLITPFATGLIADFYDGSERASLIGIQAGVNSFSSSVLSFAAGILCTINWRYSFIVYVLAAVITIMLFFKLPEPAKIQVSPAEKAAPNASVFIIAILIFIYMLFIFSFYTNIAMMIENNHLGNAATSGMVITTLTLSGLVSSLLFGKFTQLLKRFIIVCGIGLSAIGFYLLTSALNIPLVYLGAAAIGLSTGIILPCAVLNTTLKSPKAAISLSMAIVLSCVNIANFISPIFFKIAGQLFGNGTERFVFLETSICLAVAFLISIVAVLVQKKSAKNADVSA